MKTHVPQSVRYNEGSSKRQGQSTNCLGESEGGNWSDLKFTTITAHLKDPEQKEVTLVVSKK